MSTPDVPVYEPPISGETHYAALKRQARNRQSRRTYDEWFSAPCRRCVEPMEWAPEDGEETEHDKGYLACQKRHFEYAKPLLLAIEQEARAQLEREVERLRDALAFMVRESRRIGRLNTALYLENVLAGESKALEHSDD